MVGFDGSPGSERALHWAAAEARYRDARLSVVLAWEPPVQIVAGAGWIVPNTEMLEEYGRGAQTRLDEALAPHRAELAGIELEARAVHGPPARVLLEAARDAALLVVGTRGHGGFAGLMLGSVSHQCSQHASCPVVVVPAGPR